MIRFCKSHLPREVLNDAFQFSCERMKKYLGAWHVDTYPMFPGYVVLESCCLRSLSGAVAGQIRCPGRDAIRFRSDRRRSACLRRWAGSAA